MSTQAERERRKRASGGWIGRAVARERAAAYAEGYRRGFAEALRRVADHVDVESAERGVEGEVHDDA